ncbi:MAG TPA: hypothetical protein VIU11_08690 [Nakamurella sp.]
MGDIYVLKPGDSDEWRARREAELAQLAETRRRWIDRVTDDLAIDVVTVRRVVSAVFDHPDSKESARAEPGQAPVARSAGECSCSCHPRFDLTHDGGFDCPCTWSAERREEARTAFMEDAPWKVELREAADREQREVDAWLAGEPRVTARRTCFAAPEVWEGEIDGCSFFFRERHGEWRIEIRLARNGRFVDRLAGVGPDGDLVTEPVELTSGTEIARGLDDDLGGTAIDRLAFIVDAVRSHLRAESCRRDGARAFCPDCGRRVDIG